VVFNNLWFTPVNAPASTDASRVLIPIDGVYAVGEVKQRLTVKTLDAAMEKLVTSHRLERPRTFAERLAENRESSACRHGLTNPLFSFIIAGEADPSELQSLISRFVTINKQLKRLEVIRCLCVLGQGTVTWAFRDRRQMGEVRPALFMRDDLFHPIVPAFADSARMSPLFLLMQMLHLHLFHSVLAPEDIATAYGLAEAPPIGIPESPDVSLEPDKEWLDTLGEPCSHLFA
jgi:hypothetical protein